MERLKKDGSLKRCGECGNVGMYSYGAVILDEIERLKAALRKCKDRIAQRAFEFQEPFYIELNAELDSILRGDDGEEK